MAAIINGQLDNNWLKRLESDGEFKREESSYRNQIGDDSFPVEDDRYHLFVSWACPWANRTLIFRQLKNLESLITVSYVDDLMLAKGWTLSNQTKVEGVPDVATIAEIYQIDNAQCNTQVTVPILWDKKQQRIVNNESSEIIRMFNTAFNNITGNSDDYYPADLQHAIDKVNEPIYEHINNGVYRCGFATTQAAYENAFNKLFTELDNCEKILSANKFLTGDNITEADWRLFVTLIRFDSVYVGHFKCNRQRIADYPNLSHYVRQLYQYKNVKQTVNMTGIKNHYYQSHESVNPTRIVPLGPKVDFNEPHNRGTINGGMANA